VEVTRETQLLCLIIEGNSHSIMLMQVILTFIVHMRRKAQVVMVDIIATCIRLETKMTI